MGVELNFNTGVADLSDVVPVVLETGERLRGLLEEQGAGHGVVSVEGQGDSVVEESGIETEVPFVGLLPGDIGVCERRRGVGGPGDQRSVARSGGIVGQG